MLILIMMLLIALFAGAWGFMMCFLPQRWNRLTENMSFTDGWTEHSPKRLHPLIRFGNRVAGFAIFAVGCWFAYVAVTEISLVLTGRVASHAGAPLTGVLSNSPTPASVALSVFVFAAGILMVIFPAKAVAVFERVWPAGRSVRESAVPKVKWVIRLSGAGLALLALMFLIR